MFFPYHHFRPQPSIGSGFSNFWGAFFGALFAFIFGLIAYRITKRWERFVQHKNAVIKLERTLSRHLNEIETLQKLASDTNTILQTGKLTSNRLFPLKIPDGIDIDLASLDLINREFEYQTYIDTLNHNISTLNNALTRFEDTLIAGQQLHPQNIDFAKRMLDGFLKELPLLDQKTTSLLVRTKIHIKKIKERESFLCAVYNTDWNFKISKEEMAEEHKIFEDDVNKHAEDQI